MAYKNKEDGYKWLQNRRLEWFKSNGPCRICGASEDLEVDHIDPNTKISHRIFSWALNKRLQELAKCQVLCRKCHIEKTKQENKVKIHGITMYEHHGCRCKICKEAKSIKNKKRIRKRPGSSYG